MDDKDKPPVVPEVPVPTVPSEDQPGRTQKADREARQAVAYTREDLVEAYGPSAAGAIYDIDPKRERSLYSLDEIEKALEKHLGREVTR